MSPAQDIWKPATWRLRQGKNIRSATDGDLYLSLERLQVAQILSGGIAVLGVVIQLAVAVFHPGYDSPGGTWGRVIANGFIALGVVGVLISAARLKLYQGELTNRSNQRLAIAARMAGEAAERAANANARAAAANERAARAERVLEHNRTLVRQPEGSVSE